MNKSKWLIILLLFLVNILDVFTTYKAEATLKTETSPIISWFKLGWNHLWIYKFLISAIVAIIFLNINNSRLAEKERKYAKYIHNFHDYLSYIFVDKQMNFWKVLNNNKFDLKIFFSLFFQMLPISMIIMMLLASINNILTIYNISIFKEIPTQNVIHIISLFNFFLLLFLIFVFLYKRYKQLIKNARP